VLYLSLYQKHMLTAEEYQKHGEKMEQLRREKRQNDEGFAAAMFLLNVSCIMILTSFSFKGRIEGSMEREEELFEKSLPR
jgi:hypothetical protein